VEAGLRCRLLTRNHPSLLLQPLKVEEQSNDPMIVVLHDLLTDRQTDILRELGEPKVSQFLVSYLTEELSLKFQLFYQSRLRLNYGRHSGF